MAPCDKDGEPCACPVVPFAPDGCLSLSITFLSLSESRRDHQIVVISRKKAADTGSLLTHFICLALGLLSMKQMERNCIISRVERLSAAYLIVRELPQFLLSLGCVRCDSIREAWPP